MATPSSSSKLSRKRKKAPTNIIAAALWLIDKRFMLLHNI